jgi:hypothetical protein
MEVTMQLLSLVFTAAASTQVEELDRRYVDLSARWLEWSMEAPYDQNPVVDETGEFCTEGQSGSFWFTGGTSSGTADRYCRVPRGKYLFFPVFNAICFDVEGESAESDLRACATMYADEGLDLAEVLVVEIDGAQVEDVESYRVETALFQFTVPDYNVVEESWGIEAPGGTVFDAVGDGVYLLLPPLRPGVHTIDIHGWFPEWDWALNLQHTLVVPR